MNDRAVSPALGSTALQRAMPSSSGTDSRMPGKSDCSPSRTSASWRASAASWVTSRWRSALPPAGACDRLVDQAGQLGGLGGLRLALPVDRPGGRVDAVEARDLGERAVDGVAV